MGMDIEKLLRLVADYHNFCSDDHDASNTNPSGELSPEELDFIAAAAGSRPSEQEREGNNNKPIH